MSAASSHADLGNNIYKAAKALRSAKAAKPAAKPAGRGRMVLEPAKTTAKPAKQAAKASGGGGASEAARKAWETRRRAAG